MEILRNVCAGSNAFINSSIMQYQIFSQIISDYNSNEKHILIKKSILKKAFKKKLNFLREKNNNFTINKKRGFIIL